MVNEVNPLKQKPGYWSQLLFIAAGSSVLVYGIVWQGKNFFFVIYAYWFEQAVRVFFNVLKILKAGKDVTEMPATRIINNKHEVTLADYNNRKYYARFYASGNVFLLACYWVFIVVMAGFVIPVSIDDKEMFKQNILIFIFRDTAFLFALATFIIKGTAGYMNDYVLNEAYKKTDVLMVGGLFDRQTLVMHISLIFGVGAWFMLSRYLPAYSKYSMLVLALIFIVIKTLADLYDYHVSAAKKQQ